jgi:hypothetical protein
MSYDSDLVDFDVHLHARTEKAVLISQDGEEDNAVWIPLSQCQIEKAHPNKPFENLWFLTLPEWLALDKGLI